MTKAKNVGHLLITGSPFSGGKTETLARQILARYESEDIPCELVLASKLQIAGCRGCNACAKLAPSNDNPYACVIKDDMQALAASFCSCDSLTVVSPVYFSGAPSQLKAVLDRLQPFFWHRPQGEKRPFDLVVLGEGGDPYGYAALKSEAQSALAVAGFSLRQVYDYIGQQT